MMLKMVKVDLQKRDFVWLLIVFAVGTAFAYGTSSPNVMGHSAGEVEMSFDDVTGSLSWDRISGVPADITSGAGSWVDVTNDKNSFNVGCEYKVIPNSKSFSHLMTRVEPSIITTDHSGLSIVYVYSSNKAVLMIDSGIYPCKTYQRC